MQDLADIAVVPADTLPAEVDRGGRPTRFTHEWAEEFCDGVADGKSIRELCANPKYPARRTVELWLRENNEFRAMYSIALYCFADDEFHNILRIADDSSGDKVVTGQDDAPVVRIDRENIHRAELRCKQRWKWLSKLMPKRYGEEGALALLEAPRTGDNAKEVNPNPPVVIEQDPLYHAIQAWERPLE